MTELIALYFHMGMYNEDDKVDDKILGFDCPFEDSLVIEAISEQDLADKIAEEKENGIDMRFGSAIPEVICNSHGEIQTNVYRRVCDFPNFDPKTVTYSFGRETLEDFWQREKEMFFNR